MSVRLVADQMKTALHLKFASISNVSILATRRELVVPMLNARLRVRMFSALVLPDLLEFQQPSKDVSEYLPAALLDNVHLLTNAKAECVISSVLSMETVPEEKNARMVYV